jgi:hypothetical protein
MPQAPKHREPYEQWEIDLIYRVRTNPKNKADLAFLLGRTDSAIAWIWRTCDEGHSLGPRYSRRLTDQVQDAIARLGPAARGELETVPFFDGSGEAA